MSQARAAFRILVLSVFFCVEPDVWHVQTMLVSLDPRDTVQLLQNHVLPVCLARNLRAVILCGSRTCDRTESVMKHAHASLNRSCSCFQTGTTYYIPPGTHTKYQYRVPPGPSTGLHRVPVPGTTKSQYHRLPPGTNIGYHRGPST